MSNGQLTIGMLARYQPRINPHWMALTAYLILTVVMTWPMTPQFFHAIPGDGFDGWQNFWNLWWMKVALVDRVQNPFFTDILYSPTGVGLYFHTLNPFNGLATMPVQLIGGLYAAYNTVVYLSWTLAGYGVFLLTLYVLRGNSRAVGSTHYGPAFLAGAIFTFSPFHMAHLLGHMQVMSLQWIPFYILYLLRAIDTGARGQPWLRCALLASLFLVLTGLCDWYFVLYLMLFTGLLVFWRWGVAAFQWVVRRWAEPANRNRRAPSLAGLSTVLMATLLPPVVAGLVFAIVLSPILVPMVQEVRAYSFMVRPATDLYILSATLMDFLVVNRMHTLVQPSSNELLGNLIAPLSEKTINIGYLPLFMAGAGLWLDRRRAALWGVATVLFLLLAMGPRMHVFEIVWDDIPQENTEEILRSERSLFGLLNQVVPFMRMSRSVSRYALMVQLGAAVAAGVGLAALARRARLRASGLRFGVRSTALLGGALVIVGAEFWVVPYPMSPPDTPEYYTRLDEELPSGAMLNLPMNWDRPGYLLYQTVHERPLTVAYISRDDPRTATDRYPFLQHLRHLGPDILADDPARVGKTVLADLGVGVVTLDRYKMPGGAEREVTEHYAAMVFGNDAPRYEDHRITVYALEPPAAPQPYLALGQLHWGPLMVDEAIDAEVNAAELADATADSRWRQIGRETAMIRIYHPTAQSELHIRYRASMGSESGNDGTALRVVGPNGGIWEQAAAAEPHTLVIPIADDVDVTRSEVELHALGGEIDVLLLTLFSEN